MKITTEEIIKMLPFDGTFKTKLLNELETYDLDRKSKTIELIWEAYDMMYEYVLQKNLGEQIELAKKGEFDLDKEFYKKAVKKTEDEIGKMFHQGSDQADLSAIRDKLKGLVGNA